MKIAVVSNRESVPESLRIACDISRACRPTWVSPISPSISARGTSAATESITTTSSAPERTSMSAISSACSPESGCETRSSSMFTPSRCAYVGSSACSASMNAAMPPWVWASAMMWRQTVVLPEPSGPNTSTTRPRGMPPTPSAMSSASEPEGITETPAPIGCSPSFITAPLPNCFSICVRVTSSILSRSSIREASFLLPPTWVLAHPATASVSSSSREDRTLPRGSDMDYTPVVRTVQLRRRYSNRCSRSSRSRITRGPEREDPERLVHGSGPAQVAAEQHDPVDLERLALERDLQGIEGRGRVETSDRQVRGEGTLLRRELACEGLVERRRQTLERPVAVVEPGPQDAGPTAARERAESLHPRRERRVAADNGRDRSGHPLDQPRVGGAEELHRHVLVLDRHPSRLREPLADGRHRLGQADADLLRDLDRGEQAERLRLRARRAIASHQSGSGRPRRYRRTRSSAASSANRRTSSRSYGQRSPC